METYRNMNSFDSRCCKPQMNREYRNRGMQYSDIQRRRIHDEKGRYMDVDCVCKSKHTEGCHKNDRMENLGERFPIAMAYVPWQQWGELYEPECALKQGTIFKDLNLIFCGVRC